jgi:hypothetical protein
MRDNIIATERKTNDRQFSFCGYYIISHLFFFLWLLYCPLFVFLSVAIILSVICFSFCGYYIFCHLFFFLWLLYCLSFVCLSVAIMLSVICFSFCGYYIMSFVFLSVAIFLRKTNDR